MDAKLHKMNEIYKKFSRKFCIILKIEYFYTEKLKK